MKHPWITALAIAMASSGATTAAADAKPAYRDAAIAILSVQRQCDAQFPGKGFTLERFLQMSGQDPKADVALMKQLAEDPAASAEIASRPSVPLTEFKCKAFVPSDWEDQPVTADSPAYTKDLIVMALAMQQSCNAKFPGQGYSVDRLIEVMRQDAKPGDDLTVVAKLAADPKVQADIAQLDQSLAGEAQCKKMFGPK